MIRIVDDYHSIRVIFSKDQKIGIDEWKHVLNTYNIYYRKRKRILKIEVGEGIRVIPLINRAFNIAQQNKKNKIELVNNGREI